MKKLLMLLLAVPSVAFCDTKISNLTPATTMAQTDIVPIVINPGTTPANRIITLQNLSGSIVSTITANSLGALTSATAATTYLTQSSATITYCNANGTNCASTSASLPLPGGGTNYIQVSNSLQSGSTFYVSSGTVNTKLIAPNLYTTSIRPPTATNEIGFYSSLQKELDITGGTVGVTSNLWTGSNAAIGYGKTENNNLDVLSYTSIGYADGAVPTLSGSDLLNVNGTLIGTGFKDTALTSQNCIGTDSSGNFQAGTCGGGSLPLPGGATNYIQNTETLQSGATYYISSGTVNGQQSVQSLVNTAGNFSLNNPTTNATTGTGTLAWYSGAEQIIARKGVGLSSIVNRGPGLGLYADSGEVMAIRRESGVPFVVIDSSDTATTGKLAFAGTTAGTSQYVGLKAPQGVGLTGTTWSLPSSDASGCWQSDGSGNLSISACPGSGSASTLEVLAGVSRTSPTVTVGFPAGAFLGSVSGSSMTVTLNSSSVTLRGMSWSNSVDASTAAIGTATGTINSSMTTGFANVATSTAAIAASTTTMGSVENALGVSTQTLAVSTGTIYTLVNTKLGISSITATSPITYNNTTGGFGFNQTISSLTLTSSITVQGAGGIGVTYGINAATGVFVATGTTPAVSITANGTYGTTAASSGGLFLNCPSGSTGGNCANFYTSAGAQTSLNPILTLNSDSANWNEPALYVLRANNTNNNSDILVDATGTPAITIRETGQSNASSKKWQFSAHNGVMRFENRASDDSGFLPYMQVSSQTFWNDIYIGPAYGNQSNAAQVGIQISTGNTYALTVTTTTGNVAPYLTTISSAGLLTANQLSISSASTHTGSVIISSTLVLGSSSGSNGQVLTSGGVGTVPSWTTLTGAALASTQTWSGGNTFSSSSTFNGAVTISTNVMLGGSNGTAGQVFTTGVTGAPTWTTITSGTGGYALQPATVTINANVGVQATTATFSSSVTIQGSGGLGVTYGATVGSITANGYAYVVGTSSLNILAVSTGTAAVPLLAVSSTPATASGDYLLNISSANGTQVFGVKNGGGIVAKELFTAMASSQSAGQYVLEVSSQNSNSMLGVFGDGQLDGIFPSYSKTTANFTASSGTTVSTAFVNSNVTASITPRFSGTHIRVTVSAMFDLSSTNIGFQCKYTITRAGTNIGNSSEGFGFITSELSSATADTGERVTIVYEDAPASPGTSLAYTLQLKTAVSAGTCTISPSSQPAQIILEEVPAN